MTKIFISHSHADNDWIKDDLLPVLTAGGMEPLIDLDRFAAGKTLVDEIDAWQLQGEIQLLVISRAYLDSEFCRYELEQAYRQKEDPNAVAREVVPILRESISDGDLPKKVIPPIQARLTGRGRTPEAWAALCRGLNLDLGVEVHRWLKARDRLRALLLDNRSVNFVAPPRCGDQLGWLGILDHLLLDDKIKLSMVDIETIMYSKRLAVEQILHETGVHIPVPNDGEELFVLLKSLQIKDPSQPTRQVWIHSDRFIEKPEIFNSDFFGTIRHLVTRSRCLTLLIHSKEPICEWIKMKHKISFLGVEMVEL